MQLFIDDAILWQFGNSTGPNMRERVRAAIQAIENGESLRKAAKDVGITWSQFARTLQGDKDLAAQYARAQEIRADLLADEVIDISDNDPDAQRARNRIDARKWSSGKLAPKKYGDRIDLNVSTTIDVGLTLAEARARLRPSSDLAHVIDGQLIDVIEDSSARPSDKESETPDIFD